MPKAFISGCAGLALSPDERAFLSDADPWGLILFKRNVADRDQLRALTQTFRHVRRAAGRAGADRSGGRARAAAWGRRTGSPIPPPGRSAPVRAGTRGGRGAADRPPDRP